MYDAGTPARRHLAREHAGRAMWSLTLLLLLPFRVRRVRALFVWRAVAAAVGAATRWQGVRRG